MSDRLPPLTALRAFEAAARHMSFAKAAEELHVTPAALSFQIKTLEEHLGQPVFHRLNRAVELTELGSLLAPGLRNGFSDITRAWGHARRFTDKKVLTVTAGPAFTALWLAPRLFSFATQHPDIELRFSASLEIMDFDRDDIDLAVRFGPSGEKESLYSKPLVQEWLTPMLTPDLAKGIETPADLLERTLLHDDLAFINPAVDWGAWFRAAGVETGDLHGPRFNQADHTVGAALAGVGALLGRVTLAESALREGRLVMPFKLSLKSQAQFRLVCPKGTETRPQVAAFIDWITKEAESLKTVSANRQLIDP